MAENQIHFSFKAILAFEFGHETHAAFAGVKNEWDNNRNFTSPHWATVVGWRKERNNKPDFYWTVWEMDVAGRTGFVWAAQVIFN